MEVIKTKKLQIMCIFFSSFNIVLMEHKKKQLK